MDKEITNEDLYEKLNEIVTWLRFENLDRLRQLLLSELDTDQKKLAFENTDGEKGRGKVAEVCGAPAPTVQFWWIRWRKLGILQQSPKYKDRLIKICSLGEVGIDVPKLTSSDSAKNLMIDNKTDKNDGEQSG